MAAMRFRQAVVAALADEMRSDSRVIFFGEDGISKTRYH